MNFLNAEQPSCGRNRAAANIDARAAKGGQILRLRDLLAKRQAQRFKPLVQRSNRVIADGGNAALAEVDRGEGFQHIVELSGSEVDAEILSPVNTRCVLEIADPVLVENDSLYRQAGRRI